MLLISFLVYEPTRCKRINVERGQKKPIFFFLSNYAETKLSVVDD